MRLLIAAAAFPSGEPQDLEGLPDLVQLSGAWLRDMHHVTGLQIPVSFPCDSFPGSAHLLSQLPAIVVPLPPEYRDGPRAPSPLPATCAAELLALLSQLPSEVTKCFGLSGRGVHDSFHPTQ